MHNFGPGVETNRVEIPGSKGCGKAAQFRKLKAET